MQKLNESQLLYYCLPTKKGYLYQFNPPSYRFNQKTLKHTNSRQSKIQALKYRNSMSFLGNEYKDLTILCIPAYDISMSQNLQVHQNFKGYIKTNIKTDIQCYLSGKRSAIYIQNNKFIRLKGCGNQFEGFCHIKDSGLRGCHFYHTSKRQLVMTYQINKILQKEGKLSGNIPIGFFQYQQNTLSNIPKIFNIKDQLPLLPKYCCVFQTLGQRRLGTHLLSSLEILLSIFKPIKLDRIKQIFTKNKRYQSEYIATPIEWQFEQVKQGDQFLKLLEQKHKNNKQELNLINFEEFSEDLLLVIDPTIIQQRIELIIKNYKVQQKYAQILRNKLTKLIFSNPNFINNIFILYTKLGYEIGQVKRIFCQNHINWGFFDDHGVTHCNAHLNNFVVLQPNKEHSNLLAPLDFDLAFNKAQFIDINRQSNVYGLSNNTLFQVYFEGQYKSLQLSISGLEVMNFKYSIENNQQNEKLPKDQQQVNEMIKILARDTLMNYFLKGMLKKEYDQRLRNHILKNQSYYADLIEIALIISMQFET